MAIILAIASFPSSVMTHKSVPLYVRYSAQEWAPQWIVDAFLTPQWVQPNSQEHSIMLEYVFFSWLPSRAWRTHYGLFGFLGTLNEEWMDGWMEMTLSLTTHVSLFLAWSNYIFFQRYQSLQTIWMTATNLARWSISASSMWTRIYPPRQKPSNSSAANAEQLHWGSLFRKRGYFNAVKNYIFALMHSVPVGFGFELWHILQYWFNCTILE